MLDIPFSWCYSCFCQSGRLAQWESASFTRAPYEACSSQSRQNVIPLVSKVDKAATYLEGKPKGDNSMSLQRRKGIGT